MGQHQWRTNGDDEERCADCGRELPEDEPVLLPEPQPDTTPDKEPEPA